MSKLVLTSWLIRISCSEIRLPMGKTRKKYYGVKVGRTPGVYNTWEECEAQVRKFPGAVYKGFADYPGAEAFVKSPVRCYGTLTGVVKVPSSSAARQRYTGDFIGAHSQLKSPLLTSMVIATTPPSNFPMRTTHLAAKGIFSAASVHESSGSSSCPVVYSDGCCFKNGRGAEASGGIGVFWGHGSSHNISEKLHGSQTNQRAELVAACRAIESAVLQGYTTIELRTDSTYTIKSATEWIKKWRKNGWRTADHKEVKNKPDMERLDHLCQVVAVKWTHVKGHVGIPGNEAADALAKAGSSKPS